MGAPLAGGAFAVWRLPERIVSALKREWSVGLRLGPSANGSLGHSPDTSTGNPEVRPFCGASCPRLSRPDRFASVYKYGWFLWICNNGISIIMGGHQSL